MKAVILAGGYAKRFWPVTLNRPKPLLPIAGKPIMDSIMEKLEEVPEINTIYISTNEAFRQHFTEWMTSRKSRKKVKLVVEPSSREDQKLGSIGALDYLIDKEKIKDDLMLVAGDNLFSFDLKKFVKFHPDDPRIILFNMHNKDRCSRYGVVELDESMKVISFEEKPSDPKSTLISTACYIFPEKTVPMLGEYINGKHPLDKMGSFLEWLYKKITVRGFITEGYWYDIGDKHFYIQANINAMKELKEESIVLGTKQHSRITRSYVGKGSSIKNSAIMECIILDNVRIENCALRECIIDDNATLSNVDLSDSLVGSHTSLEKAKIIKSRRFFLPPVTGQELLKP